MTLLVDLLGELVAPTTCAACGQELGRAWRELFCAPCAVAVASVADGSFVFGGAVADAVRRFKFGGRPDLGSRFAQTMLLRAPLDVDVVVPVPLHPARLAERGYNQSALLAGPIARALGLPFAPRALSRVRDTPAQSTLDRLARRENLAGAFIARQVKDLAGRSVLLVDDVRTTGFTLRGCAAALHEVGARRVVPLVFACGELDRSNGSAL